jgi:two-component system, LytTR family, response regulator
MSMAHPRPRVLIVDDEPLALEGLRMLVEDDPELELVAEAANAIEALCLLKQLKPDLMLLDIQMPQLDGFQLLAETDPSNLPLVIFVTAYDRYALRAFDVHALDYLLKPVDERRFREAMARIKEHLRNRHTAELNERLLAMLASRTTSAWPTRLAVKDGDRVVLVDVAEIDWIEAADYYAELHIGGRTLLHRETMQHLEARLDPDQFVRVHRSAIVNQRRIKELRREGRELLVKLACGAEIRVAPSHRDKLDRILGG